MGSLTAAVVIPEVEVAEKAARRRFSAEYKRTVLKEAATYGLERSGPCCGGSGCGEARLPRITLSEFPGPPLCPPPPASQTFPIGLQSFAWDSIGNLWPLSKQR